MALRLLWSSPISRAAQQRLGLKMKPLRTPKDVRMVSSAAQEFVQDFHQLWNRPPKGFEKFYRDKPGTKESSKEGADNKATESSGSESSKPKSEKPPVKPFNMKINIKSSPTRGDSGKSGSSGGAGGGGNPFGDNPEYQKYGMYGAGALAAMTLYYMASQVKCILLRLLKSF